MSGTVGVEPSDTWEGAARLLRRPKVVVGVWLFVASDALTFAALFVAYGVSRAGSADWPRPFAPWPSIAAASAMTLCLAGSAVTMAAGVRDARAGSWRRCARALALTGALGIVFLGLHLVEWRRLLAAGTTLGDNPWGAPLFGATFYVLTGMHMLHVLGGIVALTVVVSRIRTQRVGRDGIAALGVYWQFVDVVWILIFALVYLTSIGSGGAR